MTLTSEGKPANPDTQMRFNFFLPYSLQDTWTDSYSIMHADVHQSYTVDGVKSLRSSPAERSAAGAAAAADDGMIIRFSRERRSCDLQDYHIDVSVICALRLTPASGASKALRILQDFGKVVCSCSTPIFNGKYKTNF